MSTEITQDGYQDIATNVVLGLWQYAELQTSDGTPITRRIIQDNTPTFWKETTLPAFLLETTVKGSDSDLPSLPVTIGKIVLFKTAVDTTPVLSVPLTNPKVVAARTDKVVIDLTLNIPEES